MYFDTDKVFVTQGELLAVWSMHAPDKAKVATGCNFVRLDTPGRCAYMAGFFERPASLAPSLRSGGSPQAR